MILFPLIYLFSFVVMSRNSSKYSIRKINIQSTYLCPENLRDSLLLFLILLTELFKILTEMKESKCQDLFFHPWQLNYDSTNGCLLKIGIDKNGYTKLKHYFKLRFVCAWELRENQGQLFQGLQTLAAQCYLQPFQKRQMTSLESSCREGR